MGKQGFYYDMTTCIGCRTCQIACKDKNNLEVGTLFRKVTNFETGAYPNPGAYHLSIACNHCENPQCVAGCPTGAMHVDADGTVQHDKSKCIGCKYCTWNCPYGAPKYIEELGKVSKCDGCKDLRDKGENPACVDSCGMRALHWGDIDELKMKHNVMGGVRDLPILPSSSITNPSLLINAKSIAKQKGSRIKNI